MGHALVYLDLAKAQPIYVQSERRVLTPQARRNLLTITKSVSHCALLCVVSASLQRLCHAAHASQRTIVCRGRRRNDDGLLN